MRNARRLIGPRARYAGGGALRAAVRSVERSTPARAGAEEVARLRRMIQNAWSYERSAASAGKEYDAMRAAQLGRALHDGLYAADRAFPEPSLELLKLADPAAPASAARGALSFRKPGYYAGVGGLPEDVVYVDNLGALRTKNVPAGRAVLHRLQEETNGLPIALEALDDPDTLRWYFERGFRELPKDAQGRNAFGGNLPALILPRGAAQKSQGGSVAGARQRYSQWLRAAQPERRTTHTEGISAKPDRFQNIFTRDSSIAELGGAALPAPSTLPLDRRLLKFGMETGGQPGAGFRKARGGAVRGYDEGGFVTDPRRTDSEVFADLREGALSGLRRFFSAVPAAVRDWPRQAWEMVRMPADFALGSPEEREIDRTYLPGELKPSPRAHTPHRPGTPESKGYEAASFLNPLSAAVFAPGQTLRAVSSPLGQATLGALASLMLPGVNMPAQFVAGNVIKPRGGQWLTHKVDEVLRPMQRWPIDLQVLVDDSSRTMPQIVDDYLEASFPGLRDEYTEAFRQSGKPSADYDKDYLSWLRGNRPDVISAALEEHTPSASLNRWVDSALRKYILRDMATPEDPVRALAERGVLHTRIQNSRASPQVALERTNAGFPAEGMGNTPMAKGWELAADKVILPFNADIWQKRIAAGRLPQDLSEDLTWLSKLDPKTPLYVPAMSLIYEDALDFRHLVDELGNAMNPRSGLPRELLLKPNSLRHLSMPQAVEHVAKINKWRMDNLAKMQLEDTLKSTTYKEYPEKGFRWVQLDRPGQFAAESDAMGHSVRGYEPPENGGAPRYGLGGWDAIKEGKAKVYSLRDAKGQPHVTIEVSSPDGRARPLATITQIKGKGNQKPSKEYLPYVQDFVRSGQWGDVRDLQNTAGMRRALDVFSNGELMKIQEAGIEIPHWGAQDEFDEISRKVWPESKAVGGSVGWPAFDAPSGWDAVDWGEAA